MSSVNGNSENSKSTKVREHYSKREKELKKQHKAELRRVSTAHAKEVDQMRKYQSTRDVDTQSSAQASIQRRDLRHQREISKMTKMQSEQLRNNQEARLRKENNIKQSHSVELDHHRDVHDSQLQNQQLKSSQVIERQADSTQNTLDGYRERHHRETASIKQTLNEDHQLDKANQEKRHRSEKSEIIQEKNKYKAHKENEIETLKRKHIYQKSRLRDQQKINLAEKERVHGEVYKDLREENHLGIQDNKDKYAKALAKERKSVAEARESVYGQGSRIARERDKLNSKIRELKDTNVRERTRADRQKRRELDNRVRADYKVIDTMFDERQKMVKEYNRINHEEITLANQRADDRVTKHYEYYKGKAEEQNDKSNSDMAEMRFEIGKDNAAKEQKNNLRFENLKGEYVNENRKQKMSHKNAVERIKNHHYNTLDNERFVNSNQREVMRERFSQKVAEMDLKHQKEIGALKKDHNTKITDLQNKHQQEMVGREKETKRIEIEKERAVEFKAQNKKAQYEYRLGKYESAHNEETKILNAQYRENLRSLIRDRDSGKA